MSPLGKPSHPLADPPLTPLTPREPAKQKSESQARPSVDESINRISNVRILNTSLPWVHQELMSELARKKEEAAEGKPLQEVNEDSGELSPHPAEEHPKVQSEEQQTETSRRLKPHSRSTANLEKLESEKPQGMTPVPAKKPRQTKWQFGIRSRNQPYEAMACLYKALEKQNASWRIVPQKSRKDSEGNEGEGSESRSSTNSGHHDNHPSTNGDTLTNSVSARSSINSAASTIDQRLNADPNLPPDYYVPNDVWFIEARILKAGMYPPGKIPSGSAHSSNVNLSDPEVRSKHLSGLTQISSQESENASHTGPAPAASSAVKHGSRPDPNHGVWVYIAIQLYTVETNNYMVDFKCDGYQNVVRDLGSGEWKPIARRNKHVEKEVSSPYPYLDVASDLIAALAQAN
jgi:carbon catabolite-derepressing protein kinase